MQWSEAVGQTATESATKTLDFEIPLDLSVTFDWSAFDGTSIVVQPEVTDEMQRLMDTYTWGSISV